MLISVISRTNMCAQSMELRRLVGTSELKEGKKVEKLFLFSHNKKTMRTYQLGYGQRSKWLPLEAFQTSSCVDSVRSIKWYKRKIRRLRIPTEMYRLQLQHKSQRILSSYERGPDYNLKRYLQEVKHVHPRQLP